jgi:hypothetical protein
MAYTTYDKVRMYFSSIGTDEVSDSDLTNTWIPRAEAWVNDKLRPRYGASVPFTTAPTTVATITEHVAAAWMVAAGYAKSRTPWESVKGYWDAFWKFANDTIAGILSGDIELSVAPADTGAVKVNIPDNYVPIVSSTDEEKWTDHMLETPETALNQDEEDEDD